MKGASGLACLALLWALALLQLCPPAASEDAPVFVVSGHVVDAKDQDPIKGARVDIGQYTTFSFDDGFYKFELEPGDYDVKVSADGYDTYAGVLTVSGNLTRDFDLTKSSRACALGQIVLVLPPAALAVAAVARRGKGAAEAKTAERALDGRE